MANLTTVASDELPTNWPSNASIRATTLIGRAWLEAKSALVLRVPSAVVSGDWNYLINPLHPEFRDIKISAPRALPVDQRLLKLTRG